MYLVMELCEGGELADMLKENKTFSEQDTKKMMQRLTSAVSYLHKNDMVHRDIKLENILMSKNPEDCTDNLFIKLTDFGLSVVKGGVGHENMMMDFCGTPMYMAPEIIDNKTYSEKCDIWAMGVIMFTLLCGIPPFQSKDEDGLYEIIKTVDVRKIYGEKAIWKNISDEAKDFICGMLTIDPAHRLTASELLDHPWITGKSLGAKQDPRNVLEMMRAWKNDLNDEEEDEEVVKKEDDNNNTGAINGESVTPPKPAKTPGSASSGSRPGSSTGKKGKISKEHSSTSTGGAKRMVRNSTDPSLSQAKQNEGITSVTICDDRCDFAILTEMGRYSQKCHDAPNQGHTILWICMPCGANWHSPDENGTLYQLVTTADCCSNYDRPLT